MTTEEIIYSVREAIRQHSDDSEITDRLIMFEFALQRAVYLRNEYNKMNRTIDEDYKQQLCMELEIAPIEDCGCTPNTDCYALRTKEKLPEVLEMHNKDGITRIGPANNKYKWGFSYVPYNRFLLVGNGKYDKDRIYATRLNDDKIYIKSSNPLFKTMTHISVTAVFENPQEAANFVDCNTGDACFDWDKSNYPIKNHSMSYITEMVINKLVRTLQLPEDKVNDAENTP